MTYEEKSFHNPSESFDMFAEFFENESGLIATWSRSFLGLPFIYTQNNELRIRLANSEELIVRHYYRQRYTERCPIDYNP